ncbi:Imm50 family immunity protein [Streptomyces sp. NPDC047017]|uniref:Imm50 family immunity protein n=1 Tax=Streptomyces sp. NPDC047017 TaxID=3155024 RepID=UPI0033CE2719
MSADLIQALTAAGFLEELRALYGDSPPPFERCDLFYLHIDERGDSVTLGFETRTLPTHRPEKWTGKGFNAFEFFVVFSGVQGLRITGWGPSESRAADLTVHGGNLFEVCLGSDESGVTFRASAVRLGRTHAYLASGIP